MLTTKTVEVVKFQDICAQTTDRKLCLASQVGSQLGYSCGLARTREAAEHDEWHLGTKQERQQ